MTLGDKVKQAAAAVTGGRVGGDRAAHETERGYGEPGYMGHETGTGLGAGAGAVGGGTIGAGTAGYGAERASGRTAGEAGYGVSERATEAGYTERTEQVPVGVVETTTTVQQPVVEERTTVETGSAVQGQAAVCGQEYFTKTEDRPAVIEQVERVMEHRPVEKEFVVETRATGVERELGREQEHLGTTERVISEAAPRAPCE